MTVPQSVPFVYNGRKSMAAILRDIDVNTFSDEELIRCLRMLPASVKPILYGMFHPDIEWDLPSGAPPYKPSDADILPARLHQQARKLYLFWKGGHPTLTRTRREAMFIELLENVEPDDAELLIACKDRRHDFFHRIEGYHVAQAWPDDERMQVTYPVKANDRGE